MSDSQKAGVMAVYNPDDIFRWDNLRNVDEPGIDFYTSIQARLKNYGEEFSTYAQAVWGKPFSNFLDSGPGHRRMDETWQPVRALGNGGFGMVGLWEKRNCQGVLEDSVAIKETERSPDYQLKRNPSVAKEAVIMRQLYDAEQRHGWGTQNNILRLRSFKFFPSSRKWRFYLEFAEYEDLYKLLSSYKTWDTYLPEEYLWHVFHSLAKVAVVMEQGPFTDPDTEKIVDGPVIHLDIKPDNVYLGKPDGKALFPHYPTIKMADFGMSEFTHPLDALNPRRYRKGTPDYYPPEHRCFTAHWNIRPDGPHVPDRTNRSQKERIIDEEKDIDDPGYKFLSTHNVWCIGKLMYDLLTLSWPFDLDDRMDKYTTEARYYGEYNEHAISEIKTKKKPEYSNLIRDLIRECLHIKIAKRPTPEQVLERTKRGLEAVVRSREGETGDRNGPRLYYMGNEINHMPVGGAGLGVSRGDWAAIREQFFLNPLWQPLLSGRWADEVKSGELVNRPIEEGGSKRKRRPVHGNVKADVHNQRGVAWVLRSSSLDRETPTQPSNILPRPPSDQARRPSNQPQPPSGQQPQAPPSQQPRRPKKRRRVMGISIDEDFQEATGRVVEGHNLRKRRG